MASRDYFSIVSLVYETVQFSMSCDGGYTLRPVAVGERNGMTAITILLVDDEFFLTEIMTDAFAEDGFDVVVANDGASAMAIIEDATVPIAALVTDINMGPGANGWTVARRARKVQPGLPVVYTTGGAAHEWVANGVTASVLVTKPFPVSEIVGAVHGLLTIR